VIRAEKLRKVTIFLLNFLNEKFKGVLNEI